MPNLVYQRVHAVLMCEQYQERPRAITAAYSRVFPDVRRKDLSRYMRQWHKKIMDHGCVHSGTHHGRPKKLPDSAAVKVVLAVSEGTLRAPEKARSLLHQISFTHTSADIIARDAHTLPSTWDAVIEAGGQYPPKQYM